MKRLWLSMLFASIITSPLAAQTAKTSPAATPPKTPKDQASYSIGMSVGKSLKTQGLNGTIINPLMLARGIVDALTGAKPAMTEAESMAAIKAFEQTMQAEQEQQGDKAKAEGAAFLAANAKKPGVKVTASGLQYKVIKSGAGATPKGTDTVKVHYHGTLTNGEKFDSSIERGKPVEFPVNGVIPGWTEALQLMKVGDKWQLYIPSDLAYGPQGRPPVIPPNAVLVFDVELLEVK